MNDKWYTRPLLWCLFTPILAALKILSWVVGDLEAAAKMLGIEKEEGE